MSEIERLWNAYVAASLRAQQTLAIADGLAAGKAWRAWLEAFGAERSAPIAAPDTESNVITLRRRP